MFWKYLKRKEVAQSTPLNNSQKKIKDNSIFCWTGDCISKQKISDIKFTGQKPVYKLESNLGWSLLISSNHKILTNKGWKKIDQLALNNFISAKLLLGFRSLNNLSKYCITWDKVTRIRYQKLAPVYDLHISNYSNYLTNHLIIHNSIEQNFEKCKIPLLKIYSCFDHPDYSTERRKPGPGMFYEAKNDFELNLKNCLMIGDSKVNNKLLR